jgi:hypothetical protein
MLSKSIWQAIKDGHPMFWQFLPEGSRVLELRAITYTYENGTARSHRLTTCDRPVDILDLSKDIKRAGGLISLDQVKDLVQIMQEGSDA